MLVDEALNMINSIKALDCCEIISLEKAIDKILFEDIYAKKALPCFDNAALDGYAINYDDRNSPLNIKGTIFAGDKAKYEIDKNECYKIMTGAIFPKGANSIVMLEDEKFDEQGRLLVPSNLKQDNARRIKGEEVSVGDILLKANDRLDSAKIMLLASQGISYVKVYARPKIAVFSSGDEINEPWEFCDERSICNANASGIMALLQSNGFKSEYKGILKDDKDILKAQINLHANYDAIITSGGASKGEADFMREVLLELGFEEMFDSLDIRPAKPTKLYKKGSQIVLLLPGNPMSCFVACFLAGIPALKKLSGQANFAHETFFAKFKGDITMKNSRANIVIGHYENGEFTPINDNKFSPAMIKPLAMSNAIYLSKIGESGISNENIIKILKLS
ncbi:molybdopterin molybdotransferase MoeA [Campylobacter hyointestinalis]|uniref:molybdopterin molybdotransferase MoeA n=1 Tax=Campylobacter hyointestinalis TaxID=198 RepID=UPI00215B7F2F|nr:molybdopterin molybdotransferase MoeA [Campylobacter hyointestinalis]